MEVMYWLIPLALVLLTLAIGAFLWAVKTDQYSDLDSPAYKILFDDDSDPLGDTKNDRQSKEQQKSVDND